LFINSVWFDTADAISLQISQSTQSINQSIILLRIAHTAQKQQKNYKQTIEREKR